MAPFTCDSFSFLFCSFGFLAGVLGGVIGSPTLGHRYSIHLEWCAGLHPLTFLLACAGNLVFTSGAGMAPSVTASCCDAAFFSGVVPSDLSFFRFLVSGKNPFFLCFVLTGLWVSLGIFLAFFFSDFGHWTPKHPHGLPVEIIEAIGAR